MCCQRCCQWWGLFTCEVSGDRSGVDWGGVISGLWCTSYCITSLGTVAILLSSGFLRDSIPVTKPGPSAILELRVLV